MHRWTLTIALMLITAMGAASAAIVKPMDLDHLVAQADLVVLGEVTQISSAWQGRRIVTQVQITPEAVFKGAPDQAPITVTVLGGEVDGIAQRVAGATAFVPQERAVLFLRAKGATHQVVGMAQGKLRVEINPAGVAMVPDLRGLVFAEVDATGAMHTKPAAPVRMPLSRFVAQLGEALVKPRSETKP